MTDNTMHKVFIALGVSVILSLFAGVGFAADSDSASPPPPPMMGGASGVCADDSYLYVVAHHKIMLYKLAGMTLAATVELPRPGDPPADLPPAPPSDDAAASGMPPHPPMGGMSGGVCLADGCLYVLDGPVVLQYKTPDMTLENTVELPKPEPPSSN